MPVELAYVLITPYSLLKSRTGGIISRLLTLSGTELVGARLYAPSDKFVDEYLKVLSRQDIEAEMKSGLLSYVDEYFRKDNKLGITNRTLLLLFEGRDAMARIKKAVGSLSHPHEHGDTVRGTYGDFIGYSTGEMRYFEPAVLVATSRQALRDELRLFAKYAESDGGVLEHVVKFRREDHPETTLVILKPDNFKLGSSRPGNIIDMFSRTGLSVVGAKMLRLSTAQAEEFYGPLLDVFATKLRNNVASRVRDMLQGNFEFPVTDEMVSQVTDILRVTNARHEFYRIVQYMSGRDPYVVTDKERKEPGLEKSLALLYRGPNAVQKIRECLGSTNPRDAAPGTVRSVYGNDLMKNGAHASDSPQSVERERRIIGLGKDESAADVVKLIRKYAK